MYGLIAQTNFMGPGKYMKCLYIPKWFLIAGFTIFLTACGAGGLGGITGENNVITNVEVQPSAPTIHVGETLQFSILLSWTEDGESHGGNTTQAEWSSSDTSVATIDAMGVATALAVGTTTITAFSKGESTSISFDEGKSGETTLTVVPPALTSIAVDPADPEITLGTTQSLTATGTYGDGTTEDLTTKVSWTSTNPDVATVDDNGVVTTVSKGSATIRATLDNIQGSTAITVIDPALVSIQVAPQTIDLLEGTSHAFQATGTYTDNSTQNITSNVSWSSSDTNVASVNADGLVDANNTGAATISAELNGISGSCTVNVHAVADLVSITVTPSDASLEIGFTQSFSAQGQFSDGSSRDVTQSLSWSVSNSDIAIIDQNGVVTGRSSGDTEVTATIGSINDSASLTVTADTLQSISITPINPSIPLNGTLQFVAEATYTDSTKKDLTQLAVWDSSNKDIVTIDATGLATSTGQTGESTITATIDTFSDSTSIHVVTGRLRKTGQTSCYDVGGNTIDCTGTGQDGEVQAGIAWPSPRFSSGLMWAKQGVADLMWQDALDNANSLNLCGHDDWYLPNLKELLSLVNRERSDIVSWLQSQDFGNIINANYWTSTTIPNQLDRAFDPVISNGALGGISSTALKTGLLYSLPVRQSEITAPAQVEATGQTTCYDSSGLAIDCTGAGQDGDLQQGLVWPDPRFVAGTDTETDCVTDELTGLMWVKTPDATPRTWQDGLTYANGLTLCGYDDWRVPNIVELYSLYNAGEQNGVTWLNSQGFSNVQPSKYWSSTTNTVAPTSAWQVTFSSGFLFYDTKPTLNSVWPVRSAN
jgi:uncharacterized protein YjdB